MEGMRTKGHIVLVENPHRTSLAAAVLLSRGYRMSEVETWLRFRSALLDEFKDEHGSLFCEYCGRGGLIKEIPKGQKKDARVATIDHVIPLSKGGGRFDRDNLKLACLRCNQEKADKMPA